MPDTRRLKDANDVASEAAAGVVQLAASGGTTAGQAVQATDARLSDARTPTAHAASHATAGTDALAPTDIGAAAAADLTAHTGSTHLSVEQVQDTVSAMFPQAEFAYDDSTGIIAVTFPPSTPPAGSVTEAMLAFDPATQAELNAVAASVAGNYPLTTLGDLLVAGAAGAPGRLGIGTAGDVLTVSGGTATWAAIAAAWALITGKPTTVAGYGITDAARLDINNTFLGGTQTFLPATGISTLIVRSLNNSALAYVSSISGQVRDFAWYTGTSARWTLRATNAAETGADAGSNLELIRRSDGAIVTGTVMTFLRASGNIGIGVSSPTARLHLPAGVATVGGSSLKLSAGVVLTVPEAGAFGYDGTNLYFTPVATRRQFAFKDGIPRALGWYYETTPAAATLGPSYPIDVDMTLTGIAGYTEIVATGSTAQLDIQYKRGAGAWTTIFSALPGFAVGANTLSGGTLSVTTLNAGDFVRLRWQGTPAALADTTVSLQGTTR